MSLPQTQGDTILDAWDYKGRPAERSRTGGWMSAAMILGVEACERLTTLGIAVNLVTYLTGTMHLGNASSANTVTNFLGTSFMLCLLGGFVADTFLGRYLTIAIFATVQATGVTILTISTTIPSLRPPKCAMETGPLCTPASGMQLVVLYLALYLTALGTGGLKSSVSGFGSDQFDDSNKEERNQMTNFFNWKWGYGICACAIAIGLVVFLSGTRKYRFKKLVGSPLTQIATVFVAAWKKRNLELPTDSSFLFDIDYAAAEGQKKKKQRLPHSKQFRFLDRAAIKDPQMGNGINAVVNKWQLSTLTDVEEVKLVLRMLPTWATTILFWTVYAQMTTFSVSQATTMDRHIGKSFQIPPASLTVFFVGAILLTVPVYDRILVPIAARILKNPQGLTPLQRIGVGLVLSILAMVAAALTELKRLHVARSHGLTDDPTAVAFTYIGQLDFFLRDSLLVSIVHKLTGDRKPWLADNLNQGKLYNFYWLLAILSVFNLGFYLIGAKWYVYKDKRLADEGIELEDQNDFPLSLLFFFSLFLYFSFAVTKVVIPSVQKNGKGDSMKSVLCTQFLLSTSENELGHKSPLPHQILGYNTWICSS
ncbi:unnamed protein product, partial [Vitis vinifera]